jgi:hypothetical protein
MATASMHARQRHHTVTEAALWLVWILARITGLAACTRTACRRLRAIPYRAAAQAATRAGHAVTAWCRRHGHALAAAVHRAAIRVELAAADLLTGPVPALLDTATARLRRRAGWLLVGGLALLNLLYLYLVR